MSRLAACLGICVLMISEVSIGRGRAPDDKESTAAPAAKSVKLEMKFAKATSSATAAVSFAPNVSNFQCTVYTGILTASQPPVFDYAYVMGSAPGDNGSYILPAQVSLGQVSGQYVFVFPYTSQFGSEQLAGVARFHAGLQYYVGALYGVPQP
jgi:hypothetical protein